MDLNDLYTEAEDRAIFAERLREALDLRGAVHVKPPYGHPDAGNIYVRALNACEDLDPRVERIDVVILDHDASLLITDRRHGRWSAAWN